MKFLLTFMSHSMMETAGPGLVSRTHISYNFELYLIAITSPVVRQAKFLSPFSNTVDKFDSTIELKTFRIQFRTLTRFRIRDVQEIYGERLEA